MHIFILESLARSSQGHPLKGRLTGLTLIAITSLLSDIADSVGVWLVEPDTALIPHYKKFGFQKLPDHNVMYASVEEMQKVQLKLSTTAGAAPEL